MFEEERVGKEKVGIRAYKQILVKKVLLTLTKV